MNYKIMLDEGAYIPTRAHDPDAGADLYSPIDTIIYPEDGAVIDTGVHIDIPIGFVGFVKSKSGLAAKNRVITIEGTVDAGYTGSIRVMMYNFSDRPFEVKQGMKISQIVICPVELCGFEVVDRFEETERGNGGFGSTGV